MEPVALSSRDDNAVQSGSSSANREQRPDSIAPRSKSDVSGQNLRSVQTSNENFERLETLQNPLRNNLAKYAVTELLRQYRETAEWLIVDELPHQGKFGTVLLTFGKLRPTISDEYPDFDPTSSVHHRVSASEKTLKFLQSVNALSVLSRHFQMMDLILTALMELDMEFRAKLARTDADQVDPLRCIDLIICFTSLEILKPNQQHLQPEKEPIPLFDDLATHFSTKLISLLEESSGDEIDAEKRSVVANLIRRIIGLLSTVSMEKILESLNLSVANISENRIVVPVGKTQRAFVSALKATNIVRQNGSKAAKRVKDDVVVDVFRHLSGVRLDFKLNPASGIAFLRMVKAYADINPAMDYREALSDLMATVLPPALEEGRLPSGANDDWDGVVKALIDRFQSWSRKAKNISYVYKGYAALLCVQRDSNFYAIYRPFFDDAIANCGPKQSKSVRLAALEAIKILVQALYWRSKPQQRLFKEEIFAKILSTVLAPGYLADAQMINILVEIFDVFAKAAFANALEDMDDGGQSLSDTPRKLFRSLISRGEESVLIALKSYLHMLTVAREESSQSSLRDESILRNGDAKEDLWTSGFSSPTMRFLRDTSSFITRTLKVLYKEVGQYHAEDTFLIEKERKLRQFAQALKCWRFALEILSEDHLGDFVHLADEVRPIALTIHANEEVQAEATGVVEILFQRYEKDRGTCAIGISDLAMAVPIHDVTLKGRILRWLCTLLVEWKDLELKRRLKSGANGRSRVLSTMVRTYLEARIIFFVCYNDSSLRTNSCDLAKHLNELFEVLQIPDDDSSVSDGLTRLLERCDPSDNQKWRAGLMETLRPASLPAVRLFRKHFLRLLHPANVWVVLSSMLLRFTLNLDPFQNGTSPCPPSIVMCWKDITRELNELMPKMEQRGKDKYVEIIKSAQKKGPQEDMDEFWLNLLHVAYATAAINDSSAEGDAGISRQAATELVQRQLLFWIVNFDEVTKSRLTPLRQLAILAIRAINPSLAEIMLTQVRSMIEEPFHSAGSADTFQIRRGRRRKDNLRSFQIEFIYRAVARVIVRKSPLRSYGNVLQMIVAHIDRGYTEILRGNEDYSEELNVRKLCDYCNLISQVGRNLYAFPPTESSTRLDLKLRSGLFTLFAQWLGATAPRNTTLISRLIYTALPEVDLERSMVEAASAMLMGPSFEANEYFSFQWAKYVLLNMSPDLFETVLSGVKALCKSDKKYLEPLIHHCYLTSSAGTVRGQPTVDRSKAQRASNLFFEVLSEIMRDLFREDFVKLHESVIPQKPDAKLLTVLLWMLSYGESNRTHTQLRALEGLVVLVRIWFNNFAHFSTTSSGRLMETNERLDMTISGYFCERVPELAFDVLNEMTLRINTCDLRPNDLRVAVRRMVPWVKVLNGENSMVRDCFERILSLTFKLRKENSNVFEDLWAGAGIANLRIGISLILDETAVLLQRPKQLRGNRDAEDSEMEDTLATLKAVAVSFSIGKPRETIEELTKMLYWGSRTQESKRPFSNLQPENIGPSEINQNAQSALVLLSEIAYEIDEEIRSSIPVIVHAAVLGLMVDNSIVVSSCKYLLVNAVHSLGINHSERIPNELVKGYRQTYYNMHEVFGLRTDQMKKKSGPSQVRTEMRKPPTHLQNAVDLVVQQLSVLEPNLKERWGFHALEMAMRVGDYRVASRSLEIFGYLDLGLDLQAMVELISGMYVCLCSSQPHKKLFGRQVMTLISTVIRTLPAQNMHQFPYVYWTCVAMLGCRDQSMERDACRIALHYASCISDSLAMATNVSVLTASMPETWEPWEGMTNLLIRTGVLYSRVSSNDATTLAVAVILLRQYSNVPEELLEYLDQDSLLRIVASLIPWMCAQLRNNSSSSGQNCPEDTTYRGPWKILYDIRKHLQTTLSANAESTRFKDLDQLSPQAMVAGILAEACEGLNEEKYAGLTNTLDLYVQTCQKMTEEHFLRRIRNVLAEAFFPKLTFEFFLQLIKIVKNGAPEFQSVALKLLEITIPLLDTGTILRLSMEEDDTLLKPVVNAVNSSDSGRAVNVLDNLTRKCRVDGDGGIQITDVLKRDDEHKDDGTAEMAQAVKRLGDVVRCLEELLHLDNSTVEDRARRMVRSLPPDSQPYSSHSQSSGAPGLIRGRSVASSMFGGRRRATLASPDTAGSWFESDSYAKWPAVDLEDDEFSGDKADQVGSSKEWQQRVKANKMHGNFDWNSVNIQ
ncbi:hypothetical protein NDN08_002009 [Rhodosorus marinus]|uniref:Non-specific serine/threonine protein kinase n=1 Tax=Rhodosorus marinus TaxID=101924 RepID=A0AAV8UWV2_9RHOD|nr:hypothetical protein NDN08_002009 [Rhodosorus marinus]